MVGNPAPGPGEGAGPSSGPRSVHYQQQVPQAGVDDLNDNLTLGAADDAPPAYGDLHDQLLVEQPGFSAGAAVTSEQSPSAPPQEACH